VVARRPDWLPAKEHLARSLLGSDPRAAAALWAELAVLSPADPYVLFNHGSTLARFDPLRAVAVLTAATRSDPANADAWNNLGNALLTLGRHDEAVAAYRRCLQIAPDHPVATANLRSLAAPPE
jgi:Flp pilus assembly protein TadD